MGVEFGDGGGGVFEGPAEGVGNFAGDLLVEFERRQGWLWIGEPGSSSGGGRLSARAFAVFGVDFGEGFHGGNYTTGCGILSVTPQPEGLYKNELSPVRCVEAFDSAWHVAHFLFGLSCSSSSTTYPASVPSEKVTMTPSSLSRSTFKIRTELSMREDNDIQSDVSVQFWTLALRVSEARPRAPGGSGHWMREVFSFSRIVTTASEVISRLLQTRQLAMCSI